MSPVRFSSIFCAACLAVLLSGCVAIDVRVKLEEDGSATVTEKVRFSHRLLSLEGKTPATENLKASLSREGADRRMAQMGRGVRLTHHEVKQHRDGSEESIAVYTIPDISDLRLRSPFIGLPDHEKAPLALKLYPSYYDTKPKNYGVDKPGWIGLHLGCGHSKEKAHAPAQLSPAELQAYRDWVPVFRDQMKDLKFKMVIEGYSKVRAGGYLRWGGAGSGDYRGSPSLGTRTFELIDFEASKAQDDFGRPILENGELVLDMIRGDWASGSLVALSEDFWRKQGVPAYRPKGRGGAIYFLPSRKLYMKYFDGLPRRLRVDRTTDGMEEFTRKEDRKK